MTLSNPQRAGILAILALVMTATRVNHFAALPDASWAVFFVAGFYLRGTCALGIPAADGARRADRFRRDHRPGHRFLESLLRVDRVLVPGAGVSSRCGSAAACCAVCRGLGLRDARAAGRCCSRFRQRLLSPVERQLLLAERNVDEPAAKCAASRGWAENLGDWYLPYLRTSAIYVGMAAALHVGRRRWRCAACRALRQAGDSRIAWLIARTPSHPTLPLKGRAESRASRGQSTFEDLYAHRRRRHDRPRRRHARRQGFRARQRVRHRR